jgi:acetate kinase
MGRVLVVNAGSTSLKLSLVADDDTTERIERLEDAPGDVEAVAHRVVHGGGYFRDAAVIDDAVQLRLTVLTELAPLHNRPAVAAIAAARARLTQVPHVAVFDTAFHATMPAAASTYAVPRRWRDQWQIRRYGFHGLSVRWASERVPVPRLVVCHLGGGCSVTAVLDGRSVETTMGFSPLEGVPMATRSGSIDATAVLHLIRSRKLTLEEVSDVLERESGLLGLSGVSARLEELERSTERDARLAIDVFAHRVASAVGAMAVALGGVDAIVFTAGIGENSASMRADICSRLGFLGVELDRAANEQARPDAEIAAEGSPVRVVVLRAREDVVAARAARRLLEPDVG